MELAFFKLGRNPCTGKPSGIWNIDPNQDNICIPFLVSIKNKWKAVAQRCGSVEDSLPEAWDSELTPALSYMLIVIPAAVPLLDLVLQEV